MQFFLTIPEAGKAKNKAPADAPPVRAYMDSSLLTRTTPGEREAGSLLELLL